MPVYAPPHTLSALGPGLKHCTSRSLFQDRFADPQAKDATRKAWFNALCQRKGETVPRADWLPQGAEKLHARLMSRLMVNLAGGVMENANLRLDRYGLPLIPGTAVKDGDLAHAKAWLAHGLEIFGLGAKTNAGYGWFAVIDEAGHVAHPLARFCPPPPESVLFLKSWGKCKLNSMSARSFIKMVREVVSDDELLLIFRTRR